MSLAATFGFGQTPVGQPLSGDNKRWVASLAFVLALHVVATMFILRWYQNVPAPAAMPQSVTMIELAPLPVPLAPPEAPPRPELQVQPKEEPVPVAKPIVQPKPHPVVKHVEHPQVVPQSAQTSTASTTPATTPPVSAPTPPSVSDHAVPRFTDLVAAQLERYKRYPPTAQRRGDQGVALLRFTLDRTGNVSNPRIERSSGHPNLDAEVLALVRRAAPLPQIPADIAANTLDIEVPVSFALR